MCRDSAHRWVQHPVLRPGVVIIKTLAFLVLNSRPSDARYIQTPIRLPMRTNLRLKVVTGLLQCRHQSHQIVYIALAFGPGTPSARLIRGRPLGSRRRSFGGRKQTVAG